MTQQTAITRDRLLEGLRDGASEAFERLTALPETEWEKGRYENGWNARQILAHIASIEWTYPRLIEVAREARAEAKPKSESKPAQPASRPASGGILSYNDRQVEKRAGLPVAELIEEFRTNRKATIAAFEAADDDLLATPIRSAGGITGPLATVLYQIAVLHVRVHLDDIVGS
ncbi:MAG: DinB family protein [Dehalococcoidia bacterium]